MRKIKLFIPCTLFLLAIFPANARACTQTPAADQAALLTAPKPEVSVPYSDQYEWRFKTIDGVLYKRLYNITKQEWVGDWIPA